MKLASTKDGPAISTKLMKLDFALVSFNLKIRNSVSDGKTWHFGCREVTCVIDQTMCIGFSLEYLLRIYKVECMVENIYIRKESYSLS